MNTPADISPKHWGNISANHFTGFPGISPLLYKQIFAVFSGKEFLSSR
jgi:hypothetical protein